MQVIKRIGTHHGQFHLDEVLACVMLTRYTQEFMGAQIIRTRDQKILDTLDLICDVGGVYDPSKHRYDHHQKEFQDTFSPDHKIRLSSAGLIYKHFGLEVIENVMRAVLSSVKKFSMEPPSVTPENLNVIYIRVYNDFIMSADAIDNGVNQYDKMGEQKYKSLPDLNRIVGNFNPLWCEEAQEDERFHQAMDFLDVEFKNVVRSIFLGWYPARTFVEKAINERHQIHESGHIVKLDRCCPWKSHLYEIEEQMKIEGHIKFVLFPDSKEGWRVQTVGQKDDGFGFRKGLCEKWRGIKEMEVLKQTSNIDDIVFVHASGFIGGAKSYQSALRMAIESLA